MYRLVGTFRLVYTETHFAFRCLSPPPISPGAFMIRLAVLLLAFGLVHSAQAQTAQPPTAAKAKPAAKNRRHRKQRPRHRLRAGPASAYSHCFLISSGSGRSGSRCSATISSRSRSTIGGSMNSSLSACEQPSVRVWPYAGSHSIKPFSKVTFPESEYSRTATPRRRTSFDRPRGRRNASATSW